MASNGRSGQVPDYWRRPSQRIRRTNPVVTACFALVVGRAVTFVLALVFQVGALATVFVPGGMSEDGIKLSLLVGVLVIVFGSIAAEAWAIRSCKQRRAVLAPTLAVLAAMLVPLPLVAAPAVVLMAASMLVEITVLTVTMTFGVDSARRA